MDPELHEARREILGKLHDRFAGEKPVPVVSNSVSASMVSKQRAPGLFAAEEMQKVPSDCRARKIDGVDLFAECLTPSSANCKFLFVYGHGRYCTHPNRAQVIARNQR